jgi:hypothetical protein
MNFNPNKMTPADVKKARVLRVNSQSPAHLIAPKYKGASPSMKRDAGVYSPQTRLPGAATPVSFSRLKDEGTYRTGMGEVDSPNRTGSDVAYTLPSRGIGA